MGFFSGFGAWTKRYIKFQRCHYASADNRLGALLVGTDVNRVYAICFGIGTACVGAAGALLVPLMPLSPHIGPPFTMVSFIIVILGGMGSLIGAVQKLPYK
jgi:branched-chain amino acid transport system permease protein